MFETKGYLNLTTRKVVQAVGVPDHCAGYFRRGDDPNLQRLVGIYNPASGLTEWSPRKTGFFWLVADLLKQGWKAPLAAQMAVRVLEAHLAKPEVEQWAVVVTENGNTSTLDFSTLELSTGYISGSRHAYTLVVNLALYGERVERLLAATEAERAKALSDA